MEQLMHVYCYGLINFPLVQPKQCNVRISPILYIFTHNSSEAGGESIYLTLTEHSNSRRNTLPKIEWRCCNFTRQLLRQNLYKSLFYFTQYWPYTLVAHGTDCFHFQHNAGLRLFMHIHNIYKNGEDRTGWRKAKVPLSAPPQLLIATSPPPSSYIARGGKRKCGGTHECLCILY